MIFSASMKSSIIQLVEQYPKPAQMVGDYKYGTAGFRDKAVLLDPVFVRMGMLAWVRATTTNAAVGLMVTASHNLVEDNGIKLVDPDGGMLAQSLEVCATQLANASHATEVIALLEALWSTEMDTNNNDNKDNKTPKKEAKVILGCDTRPHSKRLVELARQGIESMGGRVENIGVVTTPQLHHVVRSWNLQEEEDEDGHILYPERHLASVHGYYTKLIDAFCALVGSEGTTESTTHKEPQEEKTIVDAAYGVGGPRFTDLMVQLEKRGHDLLTVEIRNCPTGDIDQVEEEAKMLNNGIGAEHVQKKLLFPIHDTIDTQKECNIKFASFDGDADRIVYYRAVQDKNDPNNYILNLFDGDKIATLFAYYIQQQLQELQSEAELRNTTLGCVQTAYANGAATHYITNILRLEAPISKTGVKYCHHKALQYDIGIYFEANGHGTVLFKRQFMQKVKKIDKKGSNKAAQNIVRLEQLINQATGDAMADLLAVEAILRCSGMTMDEWDNTYTDLPSKQCKCRVQDRSVILTSDDETRVVQPTALQHAIDAAVATVANGRAFARPSGTEDAVRVYAEAHTKKEAHALALLIQQAIYDHANGVGVRPGSHTAPPANNTTTQNSKL